MYIVDVFLEKGGVYRLHLLPLSSSLVGYSSGSSSRVSASSLNSDLVKAKTILMSLYWDLLGFQLVNAGDVHQA